VTATVAVTVAATVAVTAAATVTGSATDSVAATSSGFGFALPPAFGLRVMAAQTRILRRSHMALIVHQVALEMVTDIKPLIDRIARHDRSLAQQMRKSASSVALNIGEGSYSRGGNQTARFQDAAGSAAETRSGLQVAAAWGYVSPASCQRVDAKLDRIVAMLWGLTRRRRSAA